MMTRKDYIETAKILNDSRLLMHPATFTQLVNDFGNYFERDNSRFDFEKFKSACSQK